MCVAVAGWGGGRWQSKADKLSAAVQAMRDSSASASVQAKQCEIIKSLVTSDQAAKVLRVSVWRDVAFLLFAAIHISQQPLS